MITVFQSVRPIIFKSYHALLFRPALAVPFFLVGLFNSLFLLLLYFSPRPPVSRLMAPPISKFLGSEYLHYPKNFSLILKVFPSLSLFVVFTAGIVLTAYALLMLETFVAGKKFSPVKSFRISLRKYFSMFLVFTLVFFAMQACIKGTLFLAQAFALQEGKLGLLVILLVNLFVAAFIQSVFFFAFPSLVMGERRFLQAVEENFVFYVKSPMQCFILVFFPSLLSLFPAVLKIFHAPMVRYFGYEVILVIVGFGIVVNVLIDMFVTLFSGVYYSEKVFLKTKQMAQGD